MSFHVSIFLCILQMLTSVLLTMGTVLRYVITRWDLLSAAVRRVMNSISINYRVEVSDFILEVEFRQSYALRNGEGGW